MTVTWTFRRLQTHELELLGTFLILLNLFNWFNHRSWFNFTVYYALHTLSTTFDHLLSALVTPRPDVPDKTMPDGARRSQMEPDKKLLFLSDFLDQMFPGIFGDRLCQTAPDFFCSCNRRNYESKKQNSSLIAWLHYIAEILIKGRRGSRLAG